MSAQSDSTAPQTGQTARHTPGTKAIPARTGRSLNWVVVNGAGKLLAILDSESEAHFFTCNRGHANGAIYFKDPCDYTSAPSLLAERDRLLESNRELVKSLRKSISEIEQLSDMANRFSVQLGLGKKVNADDWTDEARPAIQRATQG